nr:ATP-binding protein [Labilibaculum sp.]
MKFTDNGCISVGFVVCNGHVKFYVNDTGVGIPEDRLEAIFNRFEQADVEDTRVFEDSGLGLTISKSYVEMLGGKIWVESEVNKGSSFCFSLPYTTGDVETIFYEEKCKDNTIKNRAINDKKIKVLIAEDDYISSKFLSTILESINCEVIHCFTGEETVRTVKDHTDINIVLMDLKMPQMNGFEATERIR